MICKYSRYLCFRLKWQINYAFKAKRGLIKSAVTRFEAYLNKFVADKSDNFLGLRIQNNLMLLNSKLWWEILLT